jgi:hypothetical protein
MYDDMNDNMNDNMNDKEDPGVLKASLIAGLGVGTAVLLLGLVPVLSASCCLLVPGAGVLAAYLLKGKDTEMGVGVGAKAGCLTGIIMTTFMMTVSVCAMAYMGFDQTLKAQEDAAIKTYQETQMDPEMRQTLIDAVVMIFDWIKVNNALFLVLMFLVTLLLYGAATTLGGVIGGAIWQSGDIEDLEYTAEEKQS